MTKELAFSINQTVRLVGDADMERTFTITEIRPIGRTGKQYRCAMLCDKTGELYDGIAISRLATPFVIHGPKEYTVAGYPFSPVPDNDLTSPNHPAMKLAALVPEIVGSRLLLLVTEAAKKGTEKAHIEVILSCLFMLDAPALKKEPVSLYKRILKAFRNEKKDPVKDLIILTAKAHSGEVAND